MFRPVPRRFLLVALPLCAMACSVAPDSPTRPSAGIAQLSGLLGTEVVTMIGAGDIGLCGSAAVAQTAQLVAGLLRQQTDSIVFLAGDLAYQVGSFAQFQQCFEPFWGQFRARWRPVPGNHEWDTPGLAGYLQYFGGAARPQGLTYYAFRAGEWRVLMLDSDPRNIPVRAGSPQYEFVRTELARESVPCTLAIWHHPLFSSGPNGFSPHMIDMWRLLHAQRVDLVVNGHEHLYERFNHMSADGAIDLNAPRQITAGTGGAALSTRFRVAPNSEVLISAHGVLRLTLRVDSYEWQFIDVTNTVRDAGSDVCR